MNALSYVVIVSAKSIDQDARQALAAEADAYILKPVRKEEVEARLAVIDEVLNDER